MKGDEEQLGVTGCDQPTQVKHIAAKRAAQPTTRKKVTERLNAFLVIPAKQPLGPRTLNFSALMKMNMSIVVAARALLESPLIVTQTQQLGLGSCDQEILAIRDERAYFITDLFK